MKMTILVEESYLFAVTTAHGRDHGTHGQPNLSQYMDTPTPPTDHNSAW